MHASSRLRKPSAQLSTNHANVSRQPLRLIDKFLCLKTFCLLFLQRQSHRFKPTVTMMTAIRSPALPEAIPLCTQEA